MTSSAFPDQQTADNLSRSDRSSPTTGSASDGVPRSHMTQDKPDATERQALFVLGMHRAGTSAVTRMVNLLGARLPDNLLGQNESNPQGHWESNDIISLHEDMLRSARSSWHEIFDIDQRWFTSAVARDYVSRIRSYVVEKLADAPIFVVKDPRICLFFPLWIEALDQVGLEPRCILPFRSPIEVARSLNNRNAHAMPGGFFPVEQGHLLWLRYVLAAERHTRGLRRTFVDFDHLLSDWEREAGRIADQLGVMWPLQDRLTFHDISIFLSREHKHFNDVNNTALPGLEPVYRHVYAELRNGTLAPTTHDAVFDEAYRHYLDATHLVETYLRLSSNRIQDLDEVGKASTTKLEASINKINEEHSAKLEAADRLQAAKAQLEEHIEKHKKLSIAAERLPSVQARADQAERALQDAFNAASNYAQGVAKRAEQATDDAKSLRDDVGLLASKAESLLEPEHLSEVIWHDAHLQADDMVRKRQSILRLPLAPVRSVVHRVTRPGHDIAGSELGFATRLIDAMAKASARRSEHLEARDTRRRAEQLALAQEPRAAQIEGAAAALEYEAEQSAALTTSIGAALSSLPHIPKQEQHDYAAWIERYDTITDTDRRAIRARLTRLAYQPLISIVMPVYNTPVSLLRAALESVRNQLYTNWQLCIADDASTDPDIGTFLAETARADNRVGIVTRPINGHICAASNSALNIAKGEFIALMDHDDILAEHALYEVVNALNNNRELDLIYSDEDHIDGSGQRLEPYFKTDYNPDLLLAHNLISHLGVYRRTLVERIGGFRLGYEGSQDFDLALRAIDATSPDRIWHIPAILYHWRRASGEATFSEASMETCIASAKQAIADHLDRKHEAGRVISHPNLPQWQRVLRSLPDPAPLVSVIVPTHDRADLLQTCLDGVLNRTTYPNLEIIIVDHDSSRAETHLLLEKLSTDTRVRVVPYHGPFNFSAINNLAASMSRGSILALINNDVDVISSDWLNEMVTLAVIPEVGAVGAKLIYPDERVQHAGVVLGVGGVANHFFHLHHRDDVGYFGRAVLTSTVSAVTAACLVVRKSVFDEVFGFDAEHLSVAFNDVDLCLKILQKGYRNIWTPHALLYHHESVSRGSDLAPEQYERFKREVEFMQDKWGSVLNNDPFYNPNLQMDVANFSLAFPPRREKSWFVREGA